MAVISREKTKVLVLGGVESVPYERLSGEIDVSYIPQVRKLKNAAIVSADAVVCLTSQVSHTMVKKVKKVACRYGVPLHFLRSSGASRFQCLLEEICGDRCPVKIAYESRAK